MDREERRQQYLAKLRDPRWQQMRLKVLERDHWACKSCMDTKSTLHVHHRFYRNGAEPWDYQLTDLVTLCEACHEEETEVMADCLQDLSLMLRQGGALSSQVTMLAQALMWAVKEPLKSYEWEVLCHHIDGILRSRSDGMNDQWALTVEQFRTWCAEASKQSNA